MQNAQWEYSWTSSWILSSLHHTQLFSNALLICISKQNEILLYAFLKGYSWFEFYGYLKNINTLPSDSKTNENTFTSNRNNSNTNIQKFSIRTYSNTNIEYENSILDAKKAEKELDDVAPPPLRPLNPLPLALPLSIPPSPSAPLAAW